MYPDHIHQQRCDGFTVFHTEIRKGHDWPVPCLKILDREDERRIIALRDDRMRREFILNRCFRRTILGNLLDVEPGLLRFDLSDAGKPYLPEYPEVNFSSSRTTGFVVMVTGAVPVGIDIEILTGENPPANILQYLNRNRKPPLTPIPSGIQEENFKEWWVANEAIQKMKGIEMEDFGWSVPFEPDARANYLIDEGIRLVSLNIDGAIAFFAYENH